MVVIYAFDEITNRYVPVSKGKKGIKYNSGCCNGKVIFCKGEKIVPYFRHIDEKSSCSGGINNEGETRLHKEAKKIIFEKLNENKTLTFEKKCNRCDYSTHQINLKNGKCIEEHTFNFNGDKKIADVACVDGENISYIVEIKHTHGTKEGTRPEPWCEFKAEAVVINNSFICLRDYLCQKCIDKEKQEIDDNIERKKVDEKKMKDERLANQHARAERERIKEYYKKKEEKEKQEKAELLIENKKKVEEERQKKWNDEAPIREAEKQKEQEKNEKIKKINDEAHLRVLEQIQLQKDIIEFYGNQRGEILSQYMTRKDYENNKEWLVRARQKEKKDEYGKE